MEFTTELWVVLALVPAMIIHLTGAIKKETTIIPTFLLPYIISFIVFSGLYFVFQSYGFGLYMVNSVVFAFSATVGYDSSKSSLTVK